MTKLSQYDQETDTSERLTTISGELERATPQEILTWALREFDPDIVLACSFGGISGMALLDMAVRIQPQVRVFYLDTDFLFPEDLCHAGPGYPAVWHQAQRVQGALYS